MIVDRIIVMIRRLYVRLRYGELTERIMATAGDNVPAEIEYIDKNGDIIGFWAYGQRHPNYPYQG